MADKDLELARSRYELWCSAEKDQLQRETDDCAFYDNQQWPEDILRLRQGGQTANSVPSTPARPCITINKVKDPVRHVINELLQADFGISVVPADDWGGPTVGADEITLREGLIRRIQRQSNAQSAMMWAAERAGIAGRGYFGFDTRYVRPPNDPAQILQAGAALWDQEVVFRRFYDQRCVCMDPAHEEPDGSDSEWNFVRSWMPWDEYCQYDTTASGKRNVSVDARPQDIAGWVEALPKWFQQQEHDKTKKPTILVVEYWRYVTTKIDLVLLPDGRILPESALDKAFLKTVPAERRRSVLIKRVKKDLIDGMTDEPLATQDWPGRYLPQVKILGEEIQPYDDEKRAEGMVRSAREAQQAFNYMISAAVETIGLAPKAPVVGYAGQFEGFEAMWDAANTRTVGRLEANAKTAATGDAMLPLPQRETAEPPIQAMAMMIPIFDAGVKSSIGVPDPQMGNVNPAVRSGAAIQALIDTALRGQNNYANNVVLSLKRGCVILNDLLKPIYNNRPGRIVQMMNGTNDTLPVMLNAPHVVAPNGAPQQVGTQPGQMPPTHPDAQNAKTYTLTDAGANSNIAVKVTKHFETQREQQHQLLGELIQSNPAMFMAYFADQYFAGFDLANTPELVARAKLMLAPPVQQMLASGTPPDPKTMQQLQQSGEIIKHLTEQVQQLQEKIQAKETESAAMLAKAEMDNSTKIAVAQIQAGADQAVAQMKETMKALNQQVEQNFERIRLTLEGIQEHRLAEKQHVHELEAQRASHGHDMQALAHQHHHELTLQANEPEPQPATTE